MSNESVRYRKKTFVVDFLPWLLGAGALLIYLATLNPWITLANLSQVIKVSGWDWRPPFLDALQSSPVGPLTWLLTSPARLLPERLIPIALNLFAALCAGLTLTQLARSVALLPRDRTVLLRRLEQNEHSLLSTPWAWLPPVLAVIVCGLQMTFWEHATVGTGEMLNLLVFAYVIRCLLEFRLEEKSTWLYQAALVFGAGLANNWGMTAFLPLLLISLIWLKRFAFFQPWFLFRMAFFGLAGLSLCLLLPLVQAFDTHSQVNFWQALHFLAAAHKSAVFTMFTRFYWFNREVAVLLILVSLLPVLLMSIRWPRFSGDSSPLGMQLSNALFHLTHAMILMVCLWVMFDPQFSPRQSGANVAPGLPFLTLYYLSALAVGYFSGYFLLAFGVKPEGRERSFDRTLRRVIPTAVLLLLPLAAIALTTKNLPIIRANHQPVLRQYAMMAAESLPADGAVVLSDDPLRLSLLHGALTSRGKSDRFVLLNTQALNFRDYHDFLRRTYPKVWSQSFTPPGTNDPVASVQLIQMLDLVAKSNAVFYLHPSFGYYFERFYLLPRNMVYEMKPYAVGQLNPPPLTNAAVEANETFWKQTDDTVLTPLAKMIVAANSQPKPGLFQSFMEFAHLKRERNAAAEIAADCYSRALNYWGVQLQKRGRFGEAARHFARAVELNPDNVVAQVNLDFNQNLQADNTTPVGISKKAEDQFDKYRSWEQIMNLNGPFDEPSFVYELGRTFAIGANYRQAAQQFERAIALSPDNLPARLWLGEIYNVWHMPAKTLEIIAEIRANPGLLAATQTNATSFVALEATAYLAQTNLQQAAEIIESALALHPKDTNLLSAATRIYVAYRQFTNALTVVDRQLALAPDSPDALVSQGFILISMSRFSNAIPPLTHALEVQADNYQAMFNRAIAYLRIDDLDAAQADYQSLREVFTNAFQVYYGLGEIAYRRKDTNAAVSNYRNYLSNAVPDSAEAKLVSDRLKELTPGGR